MEKQIRCNKCNRLLAIQEGDVETVDGGEIVAANAREKTCVFSIKCPRCKDVKQVTIKYPE